ncbi:hypothetical protein RUM43_003988, partial [Polyplax serrata]
FRLVTVIPRHRQKALLQVGLLHLLVGLTTPKGKFSSFSFLIFIVQRQEAEEENKTKETAMLVTEEDKNRCVWLKGSCQLRIKF